MGSQSKRKKGTKDNRNIITDIKRETDQDANRTALQPTFEGINYSALLVCQTDYVNVTDTVDPAQTNAPQAPTQVTGLSAVTVSDNQINLTWNVNGSPGVTGYSIYRSIVSGSEVLVDSSSINSYSDDNLNPGTTYYYKIAAVNSVGEGVLSIEDSATTTGSAPPINPNMWFHFNTGQTNFDAFGNQMILITDFPPMFVTPGAFGDKSLRTNDTSPADPNFPEYVYVIDNPNIQLDIVTGFSVSFWVRPLILGNTISGSNPAHVIGKYDASNKQWAFNIDTTGAGIFFVYANGVSAAVKSSAVFTTGVFQHVGLTYDAVTNTRSLYRNGVLLSNVGGGSPMPYSNVNMSIGRTDLNISQGFYRGRVDEIQYFKGRVLTSTQINNLKNSNATT